MTFRKRQGAAGVPCRLVDAACAASAVRRFQDCCEATTDFQLAIVEFEGGESPTEEEGRGEENTRAAVAIDHQIRADGENAGLERHAGGLRNRTHGTGDVRDMLLGKEIVLVRLVPAAGEMRLHAHREDDIGVAASRIRHGASPHALLVHDLQGSACEPVGQERDPDEEQGAADRGQADQRMKEEAGREVEGHPGQIAEGDGCRAREEAAELVEVVHRHVTAARGCALAGSLQHHLEDVRAQAIIQGGRDPGQHAAAHRLEHALEGVEHESQQNEPDEGGDGAARDDVVVDHQHEQRAGQIEEVHEAAGHQKADEPGAAAGEHGPDFLRNGLHRASLRAGLHEPGRGIAGAILGGFDPTRLQGA